jgi:hypothetical protein
MKSTGFTRRFNLRERYRHKFLFISITLLTSAGISAASIASETESMPANGTATLKRRGTGTRLFAVNLLDGALARR